MYIKYITPKTRTLKGSNAYITRYEVRTTVAREIRTLLAVISLTTIFGIFGYIALVNFVSSTFRFVAYAPTVYASPLAGQSAQLILTTTPTPTPTQADIINQEVKQVFGTYTPRAMRLLDCENHARNPLAVNDNTTWGGVGQDIGIFQINNKWQGVSNTTFLEDPKINIQIAWNIFVHHGHNFSAWTCGRKLSI